jgi:hypothetical protein
LSLRFPKLSLFTANFFVAKGQSYFSPFMAFFQAFKPLQVSSNLNICLSFSVEF